MRKNNHFEIAERKYEENTSVQIHKLIRRYPQGELYCRKCGNELVETGDLSCCFLCGYGFRTELILKTLVL